MMNEIEVAIQNLKGLEMTTGNSNIMKRPYQLAIQALEKQIPKKPIETDCRERCPNCKRFISELNSHTVCGGCGQAIDWGVKVEV